MKRTAGNILFWSGTFWPNIGGVEILAADLLLALRDRGYRFMVITPQTDPTSSQKDCYKGIEIHRLPFWNVLLDVDRLVALRRRVTDLLEAFVPDLIHINAVNHSNFFYHLAAGSRPVPVLVSLHGLWSPQLDELVGRTLRTAHWVVGCSSSILEDGCRLVPTIARHSSVLPNSIKAPTLGPTMLPLDTHRVLCIGRFVPDKGFDLAIAAFADVVQRIPETRLVLVGDGPERTNLIRQARDLGISHAVDFHGWAPPREVPELISKASIVLVPSRREAFGLVALEAAWMARPVIAADVGGLSEVVVDRETGVVVEPEDAIALAEAMVSLLEQPQVATQLGANGRRRAASRFPWKEHVAAYDSLYRKLIEAQGPVTGS